MNQAPANSRIVGFPRCLGISALSAIAGFSLLLSACMPARNHVEKCVEDELSRHPGAHLVDLYKYFFQDVFGPGHLVTNPSGAEAYLEQELSTMTESEPFKYQELNYVNQFVRVNLSVIQTGEVSKSDFLLAFLQSARDFTLPDVSSWRREWTEIVRIIEKNRPGLPGFPEEARQIDSLLQSGSFVVHHSADYIRLYQPHYRIIHRKHFKELNLKSEL